MNKLCVVLLCCLLSGCAGVQYVQFDRTKSAPRSIALVSVVEPKNISVMNIGGASGAFGLVGGLVLAAVNESNSNTYTDMVKKNNVSFSQMVTSSLSKQLEAKGYAVVMTNDVTVPLRDGEKDFNYSHITANTDAVLHVWFTVNGYISPPYSTSYQPWVLIRARLINSKSKADLYLRDLLTVDWVHKNRNETNEVAIVVCGEKHRYSSFDDLTNNFQQSVDGLRDCIQHIGAQIAEDITPVH